METSYKTNSFQKQTLGLFWENSARVLGPGIMNQTGCTEKY